jgi:PadR family transcriptional regulator, regulatory protein PadR
VTQRKLTRPRVLLAIALMDDPFGHHWGYDLGKKASLRSGITYPALTRMLEDGWLTDGWEDPAETGGRPPRRYYELTDLGRRELAGVIQDAGTDPRWAGHFSPGTT